MLSIIENGFRSPNKDLQAARERRFQQFRNDHQTELHYERAIDWQIKNGSKDKRGNIEDAAWIAYEAKQYSKGIELLTSIDAWDDAAFIAKVAGKCELAHDLYRKAGNEYYAKRMEDNLRPRRSA
jgi:hypothetical protein